MRHMTKQELANTAKVLYTLPVPQLTREEKLEIIAKAYDRLKGCNLRTIYGIEDGDENRLREVSTVGTVFEEAVKALSEAGIPTNQTLGDLMNNSALTRTELHLAACGCSYGDTISAYSMADNIRAIATMPRGILDRARGVAFHN